MKKIAVLAFRGEKSCFMHALLNVVDMNDRGFDVTLIMEGQSLKLLSEITKKEDKLFSLYNTVKTKGLISAVCRGCAKMLGTLEIAEKEKSPVIGDMKNHVSLARYIEEGYEIVTF
jgi:hypothetical protein